MILQLLVAVESQAESRTNLSLSPIRWRKVRMEDHRQPGRSLLQPTMVCLFGSERALIKFLFYLPSQKEVFNISRKDAKFHSVLLLQLLLSIRAGHDVIGRIRHENSHEH